MSADQYISSGFLELYALHALSPEEMQEVEGMIAQYPRLKDELDSINQGLIKYAEVYAPETSKELYNKILNGVSHLPKNEEPAPVVAPPVIPIQKEKENQKEKEKGKETGKEKQKEKETGKQKEKEKENAMALASSPLRARDPSHRVPPLALEVEQRQPEKVVPIAGNKVRSRNGRYWLAIAACLALLLVSVSINYYQYNQYNDAEEQLTALQKQNETIADSNNAQKARYNQANARLKLYTDPQNKMVMMKGMPNSPASEVMLIWNTQSNDVFVDVHRLPAPPEGMQYQLWAIDQYGKATDAGLLTPYKERKQTGPEPMKKKVMEAAAFAITLEPKGGSESPTPKKMYVKGSV